MTGIGHERPYSQVAESGRSTVLSTLRRHWSGPKLVSQCASSAARETRLGCWAAYAVSMAHSIWIQCSSQQLCRWLLLSLDRLPSNELTMTQELIANMLGVRREGVTEAAGKLQSAGLIHYSRGRINVLDRPRLEARACECYQVVKTEFDRLLPYAIAS